MTESNPPVLTGQFPFVLSTESDYVAEFRDVEVDGNGMGTAEIGVYHLDIVAWCFQGNALVPNLLTGQLAPVSTFPNFLRLVSWEELREESLAKLEERVRRESEAAEAISKFNEWAHRSERGAVG